MLFLSLLIFAGAARAEAISTASEMDWASAFKKTSANYISALTGPTVQRPTGNLDGRGSNLTWENSLEFWTELAKNWQIKVGGGTLQHFRPVDPQNPSRRELELLDPFLSLSRARVIDTGNFTVETGMRYYFPVGDGTKAGIGGVSDNGHGLGLLGVFPYWSLLDGDLNLAPAMELSYRFDKRAAANREDYSFKTNVNLSYRLVRRLSSSIEYQTGALYHNNAGHWNKLEDNQRLIAGLFYLPIDSLSLAPTLAWGANKTFRLNRAEFRLCAIYNFLPVR